MEIPAPVKTFWHSKTVQLFVRPFLMIFNWRGRATRREVVFAFLILLFMLLAELLFGPRHADGFTAINILLFMIIFIGTCVRRMHDIRRRGWALWFVFLPYAGPIVVSVMLFLNPDNEGNPFGPDPRDYLGG